MIHHPQVTVTATLKLFESRKMDGPLLSKKLLSSMHAAKNGILCDFTTMSSPTSTSR
jgi:hypothetical protein